MNTRNPTAMGAMPQVFHLCDRQNKLESSKWEGDEVASIVTTE